MHGQLIFAWVGVSFENSDSGQIFSSIGVTYEMALSMGGYELWTDPQLKVFEVEVTFFKVKK